MNRELGTFAIGAARALTGAWFAAAPQRPAHAWVGSATPTVRSLVRSIGARDLVIGAGLLAAHARRRPVGPWLAASVVGDLADVAAALELDPRHRNKAIAIAGGFGALTLLAVAARR